MISLVFLFIFQSWQGLVASLGFYFAVGYSIMAVVAGANSKDPQLNARPWMRRMGLVAPIAFIVSGLIMYWSGWSQVWLSVLLFLISLPLAAFVMMRDRKIFTPSVLLHGLWFLIYMVFILAMSAVGSFGGAGWLPAPVDSIVVAAASAGFYWWGYRESTIWMTSPAAEQARNVYY